MLHDRNRIASSSARATLRGVVAGGALMWVLFWIILSVIAPRYTQPVELWAFITALTVGLYASTYSTRWTTRGVILCAIAQPFATTLAGTWLGVTHGLGLEAVSGLVTTITASGIAIALYSPSRLALSGWIVAQFLCITGLTLVVGGIATENVLYCVTAGVLDTAMWMAGWARLGVMQKLRAGRDELEDQGALLRSIIDTIPDTIFVKDADGRVILQNALSSTGTDDMMGKTVFDLFPNAEAEVHYRAEQEMMRTGARVDEEHHYVTEDGEKQTRLTTKVPLRDRGGEVTGVLAVSRDVTHLKESEAELRAAKEVAEERLQVLKTVVDTIPDTLFVLNREGRFVLRNAAAVRTHGGIGGTADESAHDLFPQDVADRLLTEDLGLMEAGESLIGFEYENPAPGGDVRTHSATKVPLRSPDGEVVGLVGIIRDVTDRKAVEAKIRESREVAEEQRQMLRAIVDTVPDLIYAMDLEGRFTLRNKASLKSHGIEDPASVIGMTEFDLFPEPLARQYWIDNERVMKSDATIRDKEEPGVEEGSILSTTKIPLRNEAGEVTGLVGLSRDVTVQKAAEVELRKAKEAAEAATQAKSEFLANMSHEIRTPMNGVIGMTSLLLDTGLDAEQRDFVETIRTSGDALLTIINDILDFSKIEAGMLKLERKPYRLREAVEGAVRIVSPRVADEHVELVVAVADDVPHAVLGDVTRVRQVLLNLLSNAAKFTSEGTIRVAVDASPLDDGGCELSFAVEDTGIGIAADKLDAVFGSFSQADTSTTRRYGGTGLGLTICQRLVELMGGEISAESELGSGSTFTFTVLTRAAAQAPAAWVARPREMEPEATSSSLRILLAEDNLVNQKVATRILDRLGYRADVVENGTDAIEAVRAQAAAVKAYDVVLMDVQMPEVDGLEATRQIRELAIPQPHVIALTANAMEGDRERCLEAGADDYVAKPISVEALRAALGRATHAREGEQFHSASSL